MKNKILFFSLTAVAAAVWALSRAHTRRSVLSCWTALGLLVGGTLTGHAQNVYVLQAATFCPPPPGSGTLAGKSCFDIALGNNNTNSCGALSWHTSQQANFTQTATHTQTYTFTPSGTVSNVRFAYVNTNGSVIIASSGGNSGNNISTAVTATINYNTNLNTLAAGTTAATALTADIYAIYNINATNDNNPANDRSVKLSVSVKDCACDCAVPTSIGNLVFMCYNLGAENSNLDPFSYNSGAINGDLYQWGRRKDGHQIRTSPTTTTLATTDVPGHNQFIISASGNRDWRVPQNNLLWGDVKTANDPCPAGYKVPSKNQWDALASTPHSYTGDGYTFGNPTTLYLPTAGRRKEDTGSLQQVGVIGYYWSSSWSTTWAVQLSVSISEVVTTSFNARALGSTVRCIKE